MSEIINKIVIAVVVLGVVAVAFKSIDPGPSTQHVAVTVMANSDFKNGNGGSTAPCMVMFDIDRTDPSQRDLETMQEISEEVYGLYVGEFESDGSPEMDAFVAHLENDSYRPHARRQVPIAIARGRRLFVSDIMMHRDRFSPDGELSLVKVTGVESGTISHLPWGKPENSATPIE